MRKFLIRGGLLALLFSQSCSSLFWRSASLDPETFTWNQGKLIYQVVYLERDSWNPMMGTTIKKSYQTRLTLISQDKKLELPNLPSWVLPGHVIYHKESDRLFWIQGKDDEYGTMDRKLGVASNIQTSRLGKTKFWEDDKELIHLSPSPKGDSLAYVYQSTGESGVIEYYIAIWRHTREDSPGERYSLPEWDGDNKNYSVDWLGENKIKVKLGKKIFTFPQ